MMKGISTALVVVKNKKGIGNMIIVKRESLEFSAEERRCIDMTIKLMETISRNATCPNLINDADKVCFHLLEVLDYTEEE